MWTLLIEGAVWSKGSIDNLCHLLMKEIDLIWFSLLVTKD